MNGCYSVDHCLHIVLSSDNMYDTVEKLLVWGVSLFLIDVR
jgi:hypothetical protein